MKVQDILAQITNMVQDKPDLVNNFNNLVHPDLKIQERSNSAPGGELNKLFSEIFKEIKTAFPHQFEKIVQCFANTAKKNLKWEDDEPIHITITNLINIVLSDIDIQNLDEQIKSKIGEVLYE